jgi:hypothetical protein
LRASLRARRVASAFCGVAFSRKTGVASFPEHTFALHFLLQDPKSLIDNVVSDEHLQNALLSLKIEVAPDDCAK